MSKKRKRRKRRSRSHDAHRLEALTGRGDDDEVDADFFEPCLPRGSRRFDFERWRDDLVARNLHRQRMRRRELKRGDLRTYEIPSIDADSVDLDEGF